jgi:hypothetical protein
MMRGFWLRFWILVSLALIVMYLAGVFTGYSVGR